MFLETVLILFKNFTLLNFEFFILLAPSFRAGFQMPIRAIYDFYKFCKLKYKIYRNRMGIRFNLNPALKDGASNHIKLFC